MVIAQGGVFSTNFQYLMSYKGLAFCTKSSTPLDLPAGAGSGDGGKDMELRGNERTALIPLRSCRLSEQPASDLGKKFSQTLRLADSHSRESSRYW